MIKVNDFVIDVSEYQHTCNTYKMQAQRAEMSENEKNAIVQQLIGARLLLEEGKAASIEVSDEEVEELITQVKAQFQNDEKTFEAAIKSIGDTFETFKEKLVEDILLQKYLEEAFYSKINITSEMAKEFFEKNPEMFKSPVKVKASHILVKEEDEIKAIEEKLAKGEDFAKLAEEHSLCPSGKSAGGDLGYFAQGQMVPEFDEVVFEMKVGDISKPVKTNFGYHLISLEDKQDAADFAFEDVEKDLISFLSQQEAEKTVGAHVQALIDAATIEIDESLL